MLNTKTPWNISSRDHFLHSPNQWETTLHCNVLSHWLGVYTKWFKWPLHKHIKLLWPSAIHMASKTLIINASGKGLIIAKPLPEPTMTPCQLNPWEQTSAQQNFNQNTENFIKENSFVNVVCIFSMPLCVFQALRNYIWNIMSTWHFHQNKMKMKKKPSENQSAITTATMTTTVRSPTII